MFKNRNIKIFNKNNSDFYGTIRETAGHFALSGDAVKNQSIGTFLIRMKPYRIRGGGDKKNIADYTEYIARDDPHYAEVVADDLSKAFSDYYFVVGDEQPDWNAIERDSADALSSGIFDPDERKNIIAALEKADENQVLLMHYLLGVARKNYAEG